MTRIRTFEVFQEAAALKKNGWERNEKEERNKSEKKEWYGCCLSRAVLKHHVPRDVHSSIELAKGRGGNGGVVWETLELLLAAGVDEKCLWGNKSLDQDQDQDTLHTLCSYIRSAALRSCVTHRSRRSAKCVRRTISCCLHFLLDVQSPHLALYQCSLHPSYKSWSHHFANILPALSFVSNEVCLCLLLYMFLLINLKACVSSGTER